MRRLLIAATLLMTVSACADRPWPHAEMSGDSPANFYWRSDRENALALVAAAQDGREVAWTVSNTSNGKVVPAATQFQDRGGRTCRGLRQTRNGGRDDDFTRDVVACKGKDGTWVVADHSFDKAE